MIFQWIVYIHLLTLEYDWSSLLILNRFECWSLTGNLAWNLHWGTVEWLRADSFLFSTWPAVFKFDHKVLFLHVAPLMWSKLRMTHLSLQNSWSGSSSPAVQPTVWQHNLCTFNNHSIPGSVMTWTQQQWEKLKRVDIHYSYEFSLALFYQVFITKYFLRYQK